MALTINSTPAVFSSFQDDLIFTVASDKVADPITYPNFKYIGDVYIGGVLQARIKKVPNPVTGIGVFNIGQIVRSYASTVLNPGTGLVAQVFGNASFNLQVTMKFGESYSFTDFLNVTVDSTRFFFNNYNNRLNNIVSTIQTKLDQPATNRPLAVNKILFSSPNVFVPFLPFTISTYPVVITPLLADGSHGSAYTTSITIANAYDLQQLNLSPQVINALSPGLLLPTHQGYLVTIGTIFNIIFYYICESQYTVYPVHFLNQYGGFDTYLFTKVSRSSFDIVKQQYGKIQYTVDAGGAVVYRNSGGVYNETDSVYSSQYTENLELNSDLLTDAEYVWLKDLMLSPLVYIEDQGSLYCVQIQENNYVVNKNINDELTNLTINLKYGNQLNAQFR